MVILRVVGIGFPDADFVVLVGGEEGIAGEDDGFDGAAGGGD